MSIVEQLPSAPMRVVLHGVPWETYRQLRQEPGNRGVRMTYDRGRLELMSPSKLHERIASLLAQMIVAWTEEKSLDRQSCGSVTFQREDMERGLEPDQCFYLQNEPLVRDREELDLQRDPPPDLVIEVDIASPSRGRMPLYQALRVPEIWIWRDEELHPLVLRDAGNYEEQDASTVLPGFSFPLAAELIGQRRSRSETELIREFRERIRERP
jgi:Uma2 family endonuclease